MCARNLSVAVTKYPRKPKAGKVCLDSVLEASVHD
jgi:hypothetical protein